MSKKDILSIFASAFFGTLVIMWATDDGESALARSSNGTESWETVAVEVVQPEIKNVADYLNYLGTVSGEKDGNLSFRLQGTISSIYVNEGQKVQKGELLAKISVPELDAQLKRAKSELIKAESAKSFWERERSTDSLLYQKGAIAETVYNKTEFNYEQALSSFRAAKAAVQEVGARKKLTRLEAPGNGIIGSIMVREGSNVRPGKPVFFFRQGTPIVYADILERDILKGIKKGSTVIADLGSGVTARGKVKDIEFQAKPPFRSVRVYTFFPHSNIADRPSGAAIPLKFEVNKQSDALMVPVSAVDLRAGSPRLLRVNDEMRVEAVPVELGIQTGESRQVMGALSGTDKIISAGTSNVEPGDSVIVVREMTANS